MSPCINQALVLPPRPDTDRPNAQAAFEAAAGVLEDILDAAQREGEVYVELVLDGLLATRANARVLLNVVPLDKVTSLLRQWVWKGKTSLSGH